MISKLQKQAISAVIMQNGDTKAHYVNVIDSKSSVMINKEADLLLQYTAKVYNRIHKTTYGKGMVLSVLLQKLRTDQPAIFQMEGIPIQEYMDSTLKAVQHAKKIFGLYASTDITQASDCVIALCTYYFIRTYEEKQGLRLNDFRDDSYEEELEAQSQPDQQPPVDRYVPPTTFIPLLPVPMIEPPESQPEAEGLMPALPLPLPKIAPPQPAYREPRPAPVSVNIPAPQTIKPLEIHTPVPPMPVQKRVVVIRKKEPVHDISDLTEEPKKEMTREELSAIIKRRSGIH